MRPNLGFYVQNINNIVKETEEIGEGMNPSYEEIRQAIDEGTVAEVTPGRLAEITELFASGTTKYKLLLKQIKQLKAPAKVMGIHKKLERSYLEYVAGCEEMTLSLQEGKVDVHGFEAAEKKQDEATDQISFAIQRLTSLLLK
ncbi:MAG: hypothetical protein ACK5MW_03115 [Enterococcus sp.]